MDLFLFYPRELFKLRLIYHLAALGIYLLNRKVDFSSSPAQFGSPRGITWKRSCILTVFPLDKHFLF